MRKRIGLPWMTVTANSTTPNFYPATGWMETEPLDNARRGLEARNMTGNLNVTIAVQTANDIRSPDTATVIGSYATASGVDDPGSGTSITFSTKRYYRLGYAVKLSSGSTRAYGSLSGWIDRVRIQNCPCAA